MKIALTGSRGFIGGHLMTRLKKEGHDVEEWDLRQDPPKCIKDFDIQKIDYVIHLAAYADVRQSLKEPEKYWTNNVEYCHTDSFAAGVIPIFHKHFCDNVIHRKQGKPISQCINTGTIGIDASNAESMAHDMVMLADDSVKRDEWRNMMFEFWKEHCDATIVYNDIINKTLNYNEKNETTLEDFFV